jgi:hypothetical protein
LPIGFSTDFGINMLKMRMGFYAELIVCFSFNEFEIESLLHQRKDAIIEDNI